MTAFFIAGLFFAGGIALSGNGLFKRDRTDKQIGIAFAVIGGGWLAYLILKQGKFF